MTEIFSSVLHFLLFDRLWLIESYLVCLQLYCLFGSLQFCLFKYIDNCWDPLPLTTFFIARHADIYCIIYCVMLSGYSEIMSLNIFAYLEFFLKIPIPTHVHMSGWVYYNLCFIKSSLGLHFLERQVTMNRIIIGCVPRGYVYDNFVWETSEQHHVTVITCFYSGIVVLSRFNVINSNCI